MPLNQKPLQKKPTGQRYTQNRTSVPHPNQPEKRASTPQPNSGRERALHQQAEDGRQPQTSTHNKENDVAVSHQEAAKLKIEVQDTLPKPVAPQSGPTGPAQRGQHQIYPTTMSMGGHTSIFDIASPLGFDDSTSFLDEEGPQLRSRVSFAQGRTAPVLRSVPPVPQFSNASYTKSLDQIQFPLDWREQTDAERRRRGMEPIYGNVPDHNGYAGNEDEGQYDESFDQDGDFGDEHSVIENTPSRTRNMPEQKPAVNTRQELNVQPSKPGSAANTPPHKHQKPVGDGPPVVSAGASFNQQRQRDRFHMHKRPEMVPETERPTIRTAQPSIYAHHHRPIAAHKEPFASKASSLNESYSEDEPTVPLREAEDAKVGIKRPHPGPSLDLDPEALAKSSMSDLDAIPFRTDPRPPSLSPAVDTNGTPLTLSAKLINLKKMRPEDQSTLFKHLNDVEREQTAAWFLEKFRADTQKLLTVRVERRKIALRYEMEVKKRERKVQVKRGDVENELKGLKEGGAELVKGTPRSKSPAQEK